MSLCDGQAHLRAATPTSLFVEWGAHHHVPSGPPGGPGRMLQRGGRPRCGMGASLCCAVPALPAPPERSLSRPLYGPGQGLGQHRGHLRVLGLRLGLPNSQTQTRDHEGCHGPVGTPFLLSLPQAGPRVQQDPPHCPGQEEGGGGQCLDMVDWRLGWRDAGGGGAGACLPMSSAPLLRPPPSSGPT